MITIRNVPYSLTFSQVFFCTVNSLSTQMRSIPDNWGICCALFHALLFHLELKKRKATERTLAALVIIFPSGKKNVRVFFLTENVMN